MDPTNRDASQQFTRLDSGPTGKHASVQLTGSKRNNITPRDFGVQLNNDNNMNDASVRDFNVQFSQK